MLLCLKVEGPFPDKTKTMYYEGNLTIVHLTKEDQGMYECIASNIVTGVITTSLLIIESKYLMSHSGFYIQGVACMYACMYVYMYVCMYICMW